MAVVTHATPADASELAELFQEMDKFYGEASEESVETKTANILLALFGDHPWAYALVAWDGETVVGFASYSFLWPAAMSTKSLYLKELYVKQDHRYSGVGKLLITHVLKAGRDNDCSRVEWTTDHDNHEARAFYERLGFPQNTSKVFYRVETGDQ